MGIQLRQGGKWRRSSLTELAPGLQGSLNSGSYPQERVDALLGKRQEKTQIGRKCPVSLASTVKPMCPSWLPVLLSCQWEKMEALTTHSSLPSALRVMALYGIPKTIQMPRIIPLGKAETTGSVRRWVERLSPKAIIQKALARFNRGETSEK